MKKELIIIEGTDNCGKDTLINNLTNEFEDKEIEVVHFQKPNGETYEECAYQQDKSFLDFVNEFVQSTDEKTVILNRAWYGELVYGTLYRERNKEDVIDMINRCESILKENNIPTSYIQLIGDASFISDHEDGKSISGGDIDKIQLEIKMFIEAFKISNIRTKQLIKVNSGNDFVSQENITNNAIYLINLSRVLNQ